MIREDLSIGLHMSRPATTSRVIEWLIKIHSLGLWLGLGYSFGINEILTFSKPGFVVLFYRVKVQIDNTIVISQKTCPTTNAMISTLSSNNFRDISSTTKQS